MAARGPLPLVYFVMLCGVTLLVLAGVFVSAMRAPLKGPTDLGIWGVVMVVPFVVFVLGALGVVFWGLGPDRAVQVAGLKPTRVPPGVDPRYMLPLITTAPGRFYPVRLTLPTDGVRLTVTMEIVFVLVLLAVLSFFAWVSPVVPRVLALASIAALLYRAIPTILTHLHVGVATIELDHHPVCPGQSVRIRVTQPGSALVDNARIGLECREWVEYQQGTTTRVEERLVWRAPILSAERVRLTPVRPWQGSAAVAIPAYATPSFKSAHNAIEWAVTVEGDVYGRLSLRARYPLLLVPAAVAGHLRSPA